MSSLRFLSPDTAASEVRLASPLARALGDGGGSVRAVPGIRTLDIRGDLDAVSLEAGEELVRLAPDRAFLLVDGPAGPALERLRAAGCRAYDLTGGFAAIEVEGERTLRRLTDLDPGSLPAVGAVLRTVTAVVQRTHGRTFRILVPQELAHSVAVAALDAAEGQAR